MANSAPPKLTKEQKNRLKDPKHIMALRAVRPLVRKVSQRRRNNL